MKQTNKDYNCELCKDKGYIETYNTKINKDTIEKCDNCNILANDLEADLKAFETLLRHQ